MRKFKMIMSLLILIVLITASIPAFAETTMSDFKKKWNA